MQKTYSDDLGAELAAQELVQPGQPQQGRAQWAPMDAAQVRTAPFGAVPVRSTRTLSGPTMGTRWSVRYRGPEGVPHDALDELLSGELAAVVSRIDCQMSPWKPDSDLVRLNHAPVGGWVPLPAEILQVLDHAVQVGRQSAGAFDVAVGSLVNAWGFGATACNPDVSAIRQAAAAHHPAHLWLDVDADAGRARKRAPMTLDLCGIAKGYAVDQMVAVLRTRGIEQMLVSLDGELRACGSRPDGRPWSVALEQPVAGLRAAHAVLELQDLAIATSGDYRHWIQVGPARLSHSMDGHRVAPVNNSVASVTVLAGQCMAADAWATALLVAGPEEGPAMAQRMGLEALFLLRSGDALTEIGLGRFGGP